MLPPYPWIPFLRGRGYTGPASHPVLQRTVRRRGSCWSERLARSCRVLGSVSPPTGITQGPGRPAPDPAGPFLPGAVSADTRAVSAEHGYSGSISVFYRWKRFFLFLHHLCCSLILKNFLAYLNLQKCKLVDLCSFNKFGCIKAIRFQSVDSRSKDIVEKGIWLRRATHQSFLPSEVYEETSSFSCYKTSKLIPKVPSYLSSHNPRRSPNTCLWHLYHRKQLPAAFPSLT